MTPTSDERREVADSLRARAAGVGFAYRVVYALNDGWVYRTLNEIVESIGCAENPHTAEWMARIADLIDHTCHVVGTFSVEWGDGETIYYHELSCGHTCKTSEPEPPAFCDECGCRVVRDDD